MRKITTKEDSVKILAAIGKTIGVPEESWDYQAKRMVEQTMQKPDQATGLRIWDIIRGNGYKVQIEQGEQISVRECETAEQLGNNCPPRYAPDLIVVALNTSIRITLDDLQQVKLDRCECPVIIITDSPTNDRPVNRQDTIYIVWNKDNPHESLNAIRKKIHERAMEVHEREERKRDAVCEADKKAEAAYIEIKNAEYKKFTNEEWRKHQEEAEARRRGSKTDKESD